MKFKNLIFLMIFTTYGQFIETQETSNSDGLRLRNAASRIKCLKELNDPGNGFIVRDRSKRSYSVGDVVEFACKTGYRLRGDQLLNCMSNGEWDHPQPTCERIKCLKELNDPGNGFIVRDRSKRSYSVGDVVEFACKTGYRLRGDQLLNCMSNGEWDHPQPTCERMKCLKKLHDPGNGFIVNELSEESYYFQDVVQFTCKPGYRLNGEQFLNCLSNGEWDHPQPTCEREGCVKELNDPGNGFIVSDRSKRWYNFGDVVEFACKRGYRLRGEQFLNCMSNGEWDHMQPTCEIRSCGRPDKLLAIPHSHIKYLTTYPSFQTLTVECDEWYEQTAGTATWVCNDDEQWVESGKRIGPSPDNLPKCRPTCGQRAVRENIFAPQIAGGRPVKNRGAWPWMVFIDLGNGLNGDLFCAGSLIDEKTVVTAAHCIYYRDDDDELVVWMGMVNRSTEDNYTKSFKVVERHVPESYAINSDPFNYDSDIAVLKLNQSVDFSRYIRPICLPILPEEKDLPTTFIRERKKGVLTGWGRTESGELSKTLRKVRLPIISQDVCIDSYEKVFPGYDLITENMICAGKSGLRPRDSCRDDGGSPLMFDIDKKYYINGIVSFGDGRHHIKCGKGETYGVYTKVANFVDWIELFAEN